MNTLKKERIIRDFICIALAGALAAFLNYKGGGAFAFIVDFFVTIFMTTTAMFVIRSICRETIKEEMSLAIEDDFQQGVGISFKNRLIKLLGGHTKFELSAMQEKAKELEPYKDFAESIKVYAGDYPAWKAQSEFREVMHMLGEPLTTQHLKPRSPDTPPLKHAEYVDLYLGRVVDGLAKIYKNESSLARWDDNNARGVDYLKMEESK